MAFARRSRFDCNPGCPIEATISIIDGKWKCILLYFLVGRTMRFGELLRANPGMTARVLATQLRELEADGLVVRHVYAEVPPKVEYRLSALGRTLEPILEAMREWGNANMSRFQPASEPHDVGEPHAVTAPEAVAAGA